MVLLFGKVTYEVINETYMCMFRMDKPMWTKSSTSPTEEPWICLTSPIMENRLRWEKQLNQQTITSIFPHHKIMLSTKGGFALHVKSTSWERLAHHRTRPNTNQLSSTFSSAYVREPAGGCPLRPGRRETSQGPVQSGVWQDQLREHPWPLWGESRLLPQSTEIRQRFDWTLTRLTKHLFTCSFLCCVLIFVTLTG